MGDRAERRRLERERARKGHLRISGTIENRECRLRLTVAAPHGFPPALRDVTAVVDTGCTKTSIREDLAEALGLPIQGQSLMQTANGTIACPIVLAELRIGEFKRLLQLAVPPMNSEMLFGMDALQGGVLVVDLVTGTWDWNLKVLRTQ